MLSVAEGMESGLRAVTPRSQPTETADAQAVSIDAQRLLRAERIRKALLSTGAGYASRGFTIAVTLISVPLTLHYLDRERYGLWLLIDSIIAYLAVSDLGLGSGLRNRIAEARGRDDAGAVGELLTTAFAFTAVVGVVVAVIGVALVWLLPLGHWIQLSASVDAEFRWTLAVSILFFALFSPLRMTNNAQVAYQEGYLASTWNTLGNLLTLAGLLGVIALRGNMVALAVVTLLFGQLARLANAGHFLRRHREAGLSWSKIRLHHLPPLGALSWQFLFMQVCTLVAWNSDNIVIAGRLGAGAVVPYAIAFNVMWLFYNSLAFFPMNLWPAFSEAQARGDWMWIQSTFRRMTVGTLLVGTLAAIGLLVWGQTFITIWTGSGTQSGVSLMLALALFVVIGHWTSCNAILLNALSRPLLVVIMGGFDAALNLALSLFLVRTWGPAGVAWGTLLATAATSAWIYARGVARATNGRVAAPVVEFVRVVLPPALVTLPLSLMLASARIGPLQCSLTRLVIGAAVTAAVYAAAAYLLAPEPWRDYYRRTASRLRMCLVERGAGRRSGSASAR